MALATHSAFAAALRAQQALFRERLRLRESLVVQDFLLQFGQTFHAIGVSLNALTAKIEAGKAGQEVKPVWLFQQQRLQHIQAQVAREINDFAAYAGTRIESEQAWAIQAALRDAEQAVRSTGVLVGGEWAAVPRAAVQGLSGATYSGPLRSLLDTLGPQASERVRAELITGLATGRDVRAVARNIARISNMTLNRALTISRTETMRAYRSAAIEGYRANSNVVHGWIWIAAEDACDECAAEDGSFHSLDEEMDSHVNCRCTPGPATGLASELE